MQHNKNNMIYLIAAYSKNRVIGYKGHLPWKIIGEQKRFKELTTNKIIIMGRKTYEDIGTNLKDRTTIVVTNTLKMNDVNCFSVKSLNEALMFAGNKDVFIVGGYKLYKEIIPIVDIMYITEIEEEFVGDVYFPLFDESKFDKKIEKEFKGEINYRYVTYVKK